MSDKVKSKVMDHLGKSKSEKKGESKHHVHEMHIKRADHGGFHVTHSMRDDDGNDAGTQTAVASDPEQLQGQVQDAMGDQPAAGEGTPPAPPQQAPAAGGMGQ